MSAIVTVTDQRRGPVAGSRRSCRGRRRRAGVLRTDPSLQDLPRELLAVAAVLIGVSSALGLAGLGVGAAAVATACRRWYRRADLTPRELARLKWEQAKAVAGAGSGAWRETELAKYSPRSGRPT